MAAREHTFLHFRCLFASRPSLLFPCPDRSNQKVLFGSELNRLHATTAPRQAPKWLMGNFCTVKHFRIQHETQTRFWGIARKGVHRFVRATLLCKNIFRFSLLLFQSFPFVLRGFGMPSFTHFFVEFVKVWNGFLLRRGAKKRKKRMHVILFVGKFGYCDVESFNK